MTGRMFGRPRLIDATKAFASAGCVVLTLGPVAAQQRPYTPLLTCAAVRAIVAQRRDVVLASSPTAYEAVHRDSGFCQDEVTSAPAFAPTLDDPSCFAGYRCKQRSNGEGGGAR